MHPATRAWCSLRNEDHGHETVNLRVLERFIGQVGDGADYVLDKIVGLDHEGGVQAAPRTVAGQAS